MRRVRTERIAIALLVGGVVLILAVVAYGVATGSKYEVSGPLAESPPPSDSSAVALVLRAADVDPNAGTFRVLGTPYTTGDYGDPLDNGAFLKRILQYNFDVYQGSTTLAGYAGSILSAHELILRLEGDSDAYPFDSYTASLTTSAQENNTMGTTGSTGLVVVDAGDVVPGFNIRSAQVPYLSGAKDVAAAIQEDRKSGVAAVNWTFERSGAVVIIVLLIAALIVTGVVVSGAITASVMRGHRPPSINALGWLAAFLFALFSIREQMPGDPQSGVRFDRWIFFPSALAIVLMVALNVVMWVTRDDWDLENPIHAVMGKINRRVSGSAAADLDILVSDDEQIDGLSTSGVEPTPEPET